MKKKTIENWKKALEWWTVIEVILKKLIWLKKVKKEGKKIGVNEVIKHNEIINNNLKHKYV